MYCLLSLQKGAKTGVSAVFTLWLITIEFIPIILFFNLYSPIVSNSKMR